MNPQPARRTREHVRRCRMRPLLLGATLLASCEAIPRTTIEGEDSGVLFPTGRLSWELPSDEPAAPGEAGVEDRARTRALIELDLGYGSGEFTQQVRDGQVIQVGGVPFPGPGPVDVFADLWTADFSGRLERRWPSGLGLGGRLGLRFSDLELTLRSGSLYLSASDSADLTSLGLLGGVEGFYEPAERLRLYVAGSYSFGVELSGVASGYEDITTRTLDLGAAWRVGEHVQLAGGWRRLGYAADSVDDFLSDVEITFSGPFLGLWVTL